MKLQILIVCVGLWLWPLWAGAGNLNWRGEWTQGGLIIGQAPPGTRLELDGEPVPVMDELSPAGKAYQAIWKEVLEKL